MNAADAKVHADVATYGWHVVRVAEDAAGPGFAFTTTFLPDQEYDDVIEGYSCTFRPVPGRHYPDYLGYARWYYQGDAFPALQLVWPDREHRFPWAAPAAAWVRGAQPVLADQ